MIRGCMFARGMDKFQFDYGTINAQKYQQFLQENLLPSALSLYPKEKYIFQQDNAVPHLPHLCVSTRKTFCSYRFIFLLVPIQILC